MELVFQFAAFVCAVNHWNNFHYGLKSMGFHIFTRNIMIFGRCHTNTDTDRFTWDIFQRKVQIKRRQYCWCLHTSRDSNQLNPVICFSRPFHERIRKEFHNTGASTASVNNHSVLWQKESSIFIENTHITFIALSTLYFLSANGFYYAMLD